jgi:hypothetical protein
VLNIDPAVFALFLTATGAPIASTIIWAIIDFLKSSPLEKIVAGREKLAAFLGSIIVVVTSLGVGLLENPPRYAHATGLDILTLLIGGLMSIYTIGRLAMAVHDDVNKKPNSVLVAASCIAVATLLGAWVWLA